LEPSLAAHAGSTQLAVRVNLCRVLHVAACWQIPM
jgi:hypothetical protein